MTCRSGWAAVMTAHLPGLDDNGDDDGDDDQLMREMQPNRKAEMKSVHTLLLSGIVAMDS